MTSGFQVLTSARCNYCHFGLREAEAIWWKIKSKINLKSFFNSCPLKRPGDQGPSVSSLWEVSSFPNFSLLSGSGLEEALALPTVD